MSFSLNRVLLVQFRAICDPAGLVHLLALAEDGFLHTFESILDLISPKTPCRTPLAQVEGNNKWPTLIQSSTPVNVVWWGRWDLNPRPLAPIFSESPAPQGHRP